MEFPLNFNGFAACFASHINCFSPSLSPSSAPPGFETRDAFSRGWKKCRGMLLTPLRCRHFMAGMPSEWCSNLRRRVIILRHRMYLRSCKRNLHVHCRSLSLPANAAKHLQFCAPVLTNACCIFEREENAAQSCRAAVTRECLFDPTARLFSLSPANPQEKIESQSFDGHLVRMCERDAASFLHPLHPRENSKPCTRKVMQTPSTLRPQKPFPFFLHNTAPERKKKTKKVLQRPHGVPRTQIFDAAAQPRSTSAISRVHGQDCHG